MTIYSRNLSFDLQTTVFSGMRDMSLVMVVLFMYGLRVVVAKITKLAIL